MAYKPPFPPNSTPTPPEREFEVVFNQNFIDALSIPEIYALKIDEVYEKLPKKSKQSYVDLRQKQIELLEKIKFLLNGPQQKLPVVEKAKILYATLELIYNNIRSEKRASNLPHSELENFVYIQMTALADKFKRNRNGLRDNTTTNQIPYLLDDLSYVATQGRFQALEAIVTKNLSKSDQNNFRNLTKVLPKEVTIRNETAGGSFIIPSQQIPECGAIERNYNGLTDAELRAKNIGIDVGQLYRDARREMAFYNEDGSEFEFLDDSGKKVDRSKMSEDQFVMGLCRFFNLGSEITNLVNKRVVERQEKQKEKSDKKFVFDVFEAVLKDKKAEIDPAVFIVLSEFQQGALFPSTVHITNSIISESPNGREVLNILRRSALSQMDIHKTKEGYKFSIENAIVGIGTRAYQQPLQSKKNSVPVKTDVFTGGVIAKSDEHGKVWLENVNLDEIDAIDPKDLKLPRIFTVKNEITLEHKNGKIQYLYGGLELSGLVNDPKYQLKYNSAFYSQAAREARSLLVELVPGKDKQNTLRDANNTHIRERELYLELLSNLTKKPYYYDPPGYNIFSRIKEAFFPSNTNKLDQELNKLEAFLESNSMDYESVKTSLEKITALKMQIDQSLGIQPQPKISQAAATQAVESSVEPKKHLDLARPQQQFVILEQQKAKEMTAPKESAPHLKKVIPGLDNAVTPEQQTQYGGIIAELQKKHLNKKKDSSSPPPKDEGPAPPPVKP